MVTNPFKLLVPPTYRLAFKEVSAPTYKREFKEVSARTVACPDKRLVPATNKRLFNEASPVTETPLFKIVFPLTTKEEGEGTTIPPLAVNNVVTTIPEPLIAPELTVTLVALIEPLTSKGYCVLVFPIPTCPDTYRLAFNEVSDPTYKRELKDTSDKVLNKPLMTVEPDTNKREPIETSLNKLDFPTTYKLEPIETSPPT